MDRRRSDLACGALLALGLHGALLGYLDRTAGTRRVSAAEAVAEASTSAVTVLSVEQVTDLLRPARIPEPARLREAQGAPHPPRPLAAAPPIESALPPLEPWNAPPAASPLPAVESSIRPRERTRVEHLEPPPAELPPPPDEVTAAEPAATPSPPPSRTADGELVDLSTSGALVLHRPPLAYPPRELRRGIEGTVRVGLEVGDAGTVERVWLLRGSGSEALDRAALDNVARWKFGAPDGPAGRRFRQDVRFALR